VRAGQTVGCIVRDLLNRYKVSNPSATVIPEGAFFNVYKDFVSTSSPSMQASIKQVIGASDTRVLWASIVFMTSADAESLSNARGHFIHDNLKELTDGLRARAPEGMRTIFFTDLERPGGGFTWTAVEDALIQNLFTGFSICFPVVFCVLVVASGNVLLALFATVSIAMIVVGVLGAVQVYHGWDLGIAESISGVIVIGFSVDYTVHLGHMYKEAWDQPSRESKTRFALTHMGGTVVGGGLTTALSGGVLFLCTLLFFTKMGTLLVWTIFLSMAHALLFFMACCAVFGPTGNFGSVHYAIGVCKRKLGFGKKD